MKITRIGPSFPLLTASTLGGSGGTLTPSVGSGLVPVSTGSNSWAWGSNVQWITSNGSNILQGPFVNLASGTGTSFAAASNTLTISATGSGTDLAWYDVKVDGTAVGDGVTDDTAAIQAAITAVTALGGGTIYFPPGVYIIGGALQDTGAFNGQLLLPNIAHSGVDHVVITFRGALRPGFHPLFGDTVPLAAGLSVIKSTLTGATGTASVISAGNDISAGTGGNNLEVNVRDLVCLAPDNPTFSFWNLQAGQGGEIRGLQISTPGAYAGTPTLPTNTNAYGIKLPAALFSNSTKIDGLAAGGFYTGVLWGELAVSTGPLILGPTYYGIEIPLSYYPGLIFQMTATSVVRVLRPTGAPSGHKATHGLDVLQYVRERPGSGSFDTEYDLYDPSNYGSGYIRWYTITAAGGGAVDTFLRSGGSGVSDQQLGSGWVAGAAGGDLSGTYPNPTVVDDSHSHTASTLPATSTGDHEHIVGETFSGDGATTAFEIANEPMDAEAVAGYVAGLRVALTVSGGMNTTVTFAVAPASGTDNVVIDYPAVAA